MKLSIEKGHENYACTVVRLPPKQKVEGLDNLVKVTVFGNDVLTKKDADENCLYLFFPAECAIAKNYLHFNDEFRDGTLNYHPEQKGYFEATGRVKAIKFKGIISTGYLSPITTLDKIVDHYAKGIETVFKEGDEFTDIDGIPICRKYIIKHINEPGSKESRFNKKLKRFDKLVPNQFRFHESTSHLAKNLHLFNPEDIIVITDKWHGTSAVFANVLIKKELTWKEKLAKWFGVDIVTAKYDDLYSSRTVIKNRYINKEAPIGFYSENIWEIVHNEIKEKIEKGISLYGEIVGFLPSSKHIQKGYDYGCSTDVRDNKPLHKFLVYRITYTKPDGNVIEFSWQQIKNYCNKYQLEHVKEIYFGKLSSYFSRVEVSDGGLIVNGENMLYAFSNEYLEKDCKWCVNKVPAEGICVRIDGRENYMTYKLKSKRFLERETKELDKGEVNIEDDATIDNN